MPCDDCGPFLTLLAGSAWKSVSENGKNPARTSTRVWQLGATWRLAGWLAGGRERRLIQYLVNNPRAIWRVYSSDHETGPEG